MPSISYLKNDTTPTIVMTGINYGQYVSKSSLIPFIYGRYTVMYNINEILIPIPIIAISKKNMTL